MQLVTSTAKIYSIFDLNSKYESRLKILNLYGRKINHDYHIVSSWNLKLFFNNYFCILLIKMYFIMCAATLRLFIVFSILKKIFD